MRSEAKVVIDTVAVMACNHVSQARLTPGFTAGPLRVQAGTLLTIPAITD